jgi:hypothetical protein
MEQALGITLGHRLRSHGRTAPKGTAGGTHRAIRDMVVRQCGGAAVGACLLTAILQSFVLHAALCSI